MRTHKLIRLVLSAILLSAMCNFTIAQSATKPATNPAYGGQPVFPQAQAGSGTRNAPAGSGTRNATVGSGTRNATVGSGTRNAPAGSSNKNATLAMDGYCPVCIVEMKKWMRGDARHQVTYDGKVYRFPGEEQKNMFIADPVKYAPALGGDCVVCLTNMNQRVPGSVQTGSLYEGRVYLFPNEAQREEFRANPEKFKAADVANGGKCAVCKVEMNQDMQGKPEISALHGGLRYFFPGEQQRQMFLANPAKYTGR